MSRPLPPFLGAAVLAVVLVVGISGRASAPAGRYTVDTDTVYDATTKLTWQRVPSPAKYQQGDAVAYCSTLTLGGASWRLAKMKELVTILDFSVAAPGPTIDPVAFPSTPSDDFWASTLYAGLSGNAWYVNFGASYTDYDVVTDMKYARCVH